MEPLRSRFKTTFPEKFFLNENKEELKAYLKKQGWLEEAEEILYAEKPGEGNMNFVLRIATNRKTFIIKQARPWVEKYPQIDAPVERNSVEALYFEIVGKNDWLRDRSPHLLGKDQDNFIFLVNDLGKTGDYTFLYKKGNNLEISVFNQLVDYLSALHQAQVDHFPENLNMRLLNHEHIFNYPFLENNGLNLDLFTPGLEKAALPIKKNHILKSRINDLGKLYLQEGPVLIHGDYYPGSWLNTPNGIFVIDPEFGFKGFPEFDLGVFIAHLGLTSQPDDSTIQVLERYKTDRTLNLKLVFGFAGTEILRRLLGVAQLPVDLSLDEKQHLIHMAENWILKDHF